MQRCPVRSACVLGMDADMRTTWEARACSLGEGSSVEGEERVSMAALAPAVVSRDLDTWRFLARQLYASPQAFVGFAPASLVQLAVNRHLRAHRIRRVPRIRNREAIERQSRLAGLTGRVKAFRHSPVAVLVRLCECWKRA